tara:strand:+ start:577 stop:849 length:273 start_codon:yes stop_codon:yes gene_type:complete
MARDKDQIAQHHAAMLGSVSVINSVIATHNKGSNATDEDFGHDMTHDEKKERVARSNGYLVHMKALDDWGNESFTEIDAAISAANSFVGG